MWEIYESLESFLHYFGLKIIGPSFFFQSFILPTQKIIRCPWCAKHCARSWNFTVKTSKKQVTVLTASCNCC